MCMSGEDFCLNFNMLLVFKLKSFVLNLRDATKGGKQAELTQLAADGGQSASLVQARDKANTLTLIVSIFSTS